MDELLEFSINFFAWADSSVTIYSWLIVALWLALIGYWAISASSAKRNVGEQVGRKATGLRLSIIVLALLALRVPVVRHAFQNVQAPVSSSMVMGLIGVVLCALGIGLAILARVYLGRNWGMPMAQKENPELVTTGPYAFVRHPIYMGMLLAMLGSAIGASVFWVLPLILFGAYFIYSARHEEILMIKQFPEQYPSYIKRTKMLLPFLL
jgi:protein-S-isoprenylcysteine O-methyltransferase Ste14